MAAQPMATHTITDQKMCLNPEMSNTTGANPEILNTTCLNPEMSNTIDVNPEISNTGVKHERRYGINIVKGTTDPRH